MFGLSRKQADIINAAAGPIPAPQPVVVAAAVDAPKVEPPAMTLPQPALRKSRVEELAEYAKTAQEIGLAVPSLRIEEFVSALERLNFPVYDLHAVVAYMDDKATREGLGYGWRWLPVREKDRFPGEFGGRPDDWRRDRIGPSSDRYIASGQWGVVPTYAQTIPLHALQRIAAVEREYKEPVHFLVCDYAVAPERLPDPFLMAVIPNAELTAGVGRFVIDFWDEPGFGIDKMLA